MPQLEGIRIKNFRALKNVSMGRLFRQQNVDPLTPLTAVIGKNGVGKSSLFDAFGFIADCLKLGIEEACDASGRGGFSRIRSGGQSGPIEFEFYFKVKKSTRPTTYELSIDIDDQTMRPFVALERLRQGRKDKKGGYPYTFLSLEKGRGFVWKGDTPNGSVERENVEIDGSRPGISTFGALKQHPHISQFRNFIENWYLSYFTPDAARALPLAGPQKRLNAHGDNLGNVVQFMERQHPKLFKDILKQIAAKIPGVREIKTEATVDGRLVLCFNERGFKDPFYVQQMSDGTLKVFAYLMLLADPTPPSFLCIEEPENGLYPQLLESLASEFRKYASDPKSKSQIFVTTHEPNFVDALSPDEMWVLKKGKDGFSQIKRASSFPHVKQLYEQELPLGGLWLSDYLEEEEEANAL